MAQRTPEGAGGDADELPRIASDAERRGALLAAGAVLVLFGLVLLGWAVLGRAYTGAGEPASSERAR